MIALQYLGKKLQLSYGSKYVWGLYLGGAIAGSIAMNYLMPYFYILIPQVGADPSISAFIGFFATMNPRLTIFTLGVPFKCWFLLLCGLGLLLVFDPSYKDIGGLAVGVGAGLLRRSRIL
jgi:membrane associated rhomboid family serine protease